ncbi:MAG: cob(I)yrinic acid a,c-diamide adenosyltransferase [Planctomycetota bacterium]|jgi:cob(I)alamin adenosyltransferase
MIEKGLVHYYYGTGKGKTTAALGLALRMLGHGGKVECFCFMKSSNRYGEFRAAEKYGDSFAITLTGPPCRNPKSGDTGFICEGCMACHVNAGNPSPEDASAAGNGIELASNAMQGGDAGLVILDEIGYAASYGLLDIKRIEEVIRSRLPEVEVVLTGGRSKIPQFEDIADYVTEVNEFNHHYKTGRIEVQGIDY